MREEFRGSAGLLVLCLWLVPDGIKFYSSLLLRFFGNQFLIQVSILFMLFIRFATLFEYFNPCSSWVKVVFVVQEWCLDSVTHGCTLYSRSVVAHEGDSYSLVESFVVHLLFVG